VFEVRSSVQRACASLCLVLFLLFVSLKQKVHNKVLDCFVAALELLCSPELVVKASLRLQA